MEINNNVVFSYCKNKNGEVTNVVYKYLDTDTMRGDLVKMLGEERDKYCDDDDLHGFYVDDDEIEEYAEYLVESFNNDMKKYLHQEEHKIFGNFNNIDYDYDKHLWAVSDGKYGEDHIDYNYQGVEEMIARLDSGEDSELANFERKALTDWFWDTFGSWGICYNFTEHLNCKYEDYKYCEGISDDDED